jgi:hypothetical protein
MGPLEKEIAIYMSSRLGHIDSPWASAADLKKWWFSQHEKDMRASYVITGSTPEHKTLYNAFLARGNALSTKERV